MHHTGIIYNTFIVGHFSIILVKYYQNPSSGLRRCCLRDTMSSELKVCTVYTTYTPQCCLSVTLTYIIRKQEIQGCQPARFRKLALMCP
jgi:hypothetical protein